jgi:hypothetical protein
VNDAHRHDRSWVVRTDLLTAASPERSRGECRVTVTRCASATEASTTLTKHRREAAPRVTTSLSAHESAPCILRAHDREDSGRHHERSRNEVREHILPDLFDVGLDGLGQTPRPVVRSDVAHE